MRVAIVCPPIQDFYTTPHRLTALGCKALAESLHNTGFETVFFNFPILAQPTKIDLPKELNYLKPHILPNETGKASFFTSFKHFGPSFLEAAKQIIQSKPEILLLSSFAYAYADDALNLARAVKKLNPSLFILAGGPGPSAFPAYYLAEPAIDAIFLGEADEAIVSIVKSYQNKNLYSQFFKGLYFRNKSAEKNFFTSTYQSAICHKLKPVWNNSLALGEKQLFAFSLARGCPKACRFCSNHLVQGHQFRKTELSELKIQLKKLIENLKKPVKAIHFDFEDDNLLLEPEFFIEVLNIFKFFFPQATFSAENGLDYSLLTPDLLELLINQGFTQFNFSLVSLASPVLKANQRSLELELFLKLLKTLKRRRPVVCYFIAGFPEDTIESVCQTLSFLAKLPITIGFSPFYSLPGLPGFKQTEQPKPRLSLGSAFFPWHNSLSSETLITIFRLVRLLNLQKSIKNPLEKELVKKTFTTEKLFSIIKKKKQKIIVPLSVYDKDLVSYFFKRLKAS